MELYAARVAPTSRESLGSRAIRADRTTGKGKGHGDGGFGAVGPGHGGDDGGHVRQDGRGHPVGPEAPASRPRVLGIHPTAAARQEWASGHRFGEPPRQSRRFNSEGVAVQDAPDLAPASTTQAGVGTDGIGCRANDATDRGIPHPCLYPHLRQWPPGAPTRRRRHCPAPGRAPFDGPLCLSNAYGGCLYWLHVHSNDGVFTSSRRPGRYSQWDSSSISGARPSALDRLVRLGEGWLGSRTASGLATRDPFPCFPKPSSSWTSVAPSSLPGIHLQGKQSVRLDCDLLDRIEALCG